MQVNKVKIFLLISLSALFILGSESLAFAGGYHVNVKIIDFQIMGNDEYTVSFEIAKEQTQRYLNSLIQDEPIVLHVRFNGNLEPMYSKEQYIKSLNIMLDYFSKREEFELGFGYRPKSFKDKGNYFKCDGLVPHNKGVMTVKKTKELE